MPKTFVFALFGALSAFAVAAFSAPSAAGHLGQTHTVNGLTLYLGVVPAEILRQNPDRYPSHEQRKIPASKYAHHVMLALFDTASGARVTDAVVEARVAPLALAGSKKRLEPMVIAGALTYCNYFLISPLDTTVIQAEIQRPDAARVIRARFILEPHAQ